MNYKSPIQKVMAPAMEQAGFSFLAIGYNHFRFANGSETQEIVIDTARYGVRNLRFAYHGTGERRFWFGLEDLDPQFCPAAGMEYRTREELIPYLRQVTEDTVRILLPYLDAMVENYVAYTDVLSREMARDIQERIKRAQAQWGLALEYGPDQLRRLDAAMDALRTAAVRRREDFQRHREEILDLAAFYGELLNDEEETPGLWGTLNMWWAQDGTTPCGGRCWPGILARRWRRTPCRGTISRWNAGALEPRHPENGDPF